MRFLSQAMPLNAATMPAASSASAAPMRAAVILALALLHIASAPAMATDLTLGPPDARGDDAFNQWYYATNGAASLSIENGDPPSGAHDFALGNSTAGRENHADWRSRIFPLGPAARGSEPITFSFSYKLPDKVNEGDNIRVQLRFYGKSTNFISQKDFLLGSMSRDSEMTGYKEVAVRDIRPPLRAESADVTLSANFYDVDRWTSGTGRFEGFSVVTVARYPALRIAIAVATLAAIVAVTASISVFMTVLIMKKRRARQPPAAR